MRMQQTKGDLHTPTFIKSTVSSNASHKDGDGRKGTYRIKNRNSIRNTTRERIRARMKSPWKMELKGHMVKMERSTIGNVYFCLDTP